MRLLDPFRSDSRRALNATRPRRLATLVSTLVTLVLAFWLGLSIPWWALLSLIALEMLIWAVIGSYWADRDAAAADASEQDQNHDER